MTPLSQPGSVSWGTEGGPGWCLQSTGSPPAEGGQAPSLGSDILLTSAQPMVAQSLQSEEGHSTRQGWAKGTIPLSWTSYSRSPAQGPWPK